MAIHRPSRIFCWFPPDSVLIARAGDALVAAVAGYVPDAQPVGAAVVADGLELAAVPPRGEVAGHRLAQPGQALDELHLPLALEPGQAEDLPGADLQRDRLGGLAQGQLLCLQHGGAQHRGPRLGRLPGASPGRR
jgi:hypothetical protein